MASADCVIMRVLGSKEESDYYEAFGIGKRIFDKILSHFEREYKTRLVRRPVHPENPGSSRPGRRRYGPRQSLALVLVHLVSCPGSKHIQLEKYGSRSTTLRYVLFTMTCLGYALRNMHKARIELPRRNDGTVKLCTSILSF